MSEQTKLPPCPWCDQHDKVTPLVEGSRTLWCERCGDCGLPHEWARIRIAKLKFAETFLAHARCQNWHVVATTVDRQLSEVRDEIKQWEGEGGE